MLQHCKLPTTDMVPALALGAELPETGAMEQPPRPKKKPLLDFWLLVRAYVFLGVIEGSQAWLAFSWFSGVMAMQWLIFNKSLQLSCLALPLPVSLLFIVRQPQ